MINQTNNEGSYSALQQVDQTLFPISDLPTPIIIRIMSLAENISPLNFIVNRAMFAITKGDHYYNNLYANIKAQIRDQDYWNQWGDPGEVPRLPISWLLQFNPKEEAMVFVPQRLIRKVNNAIEYLNLKTMGQWASNPVQGHPLSYAPKGWKEAIEKHRKVEAPHWIRIKRKTVVPTEEAPHWIRIKRETVVPTENFDKRDIFAGVVDLAVAIFAMFNATGQPCFESPKPSPLFNEIDPPCISLPEKINGKRIGLRFQNDGIKVCVDRSDIHHYIAVKRWFGEQNGKPISPSGMYYPELSGLSIEALKKKHEEVQQEALKALANIRKSKSVYRADSKLQAAFAVAREKVSELIRALLERFPEHHTKMVIAQQELDEGVKPLESPSDLTLEGKLQFKADHTDDMRKEAESKVVRIGQHMDATMIDFWNQLSPELNDEFQAMYDQLNKQIAVFAEGKRDNSQELKAAIEFLGNIHDRHIVNGHDPVEDLEAISSSGSLDLEQFLYEFICTRIDQGDIAYASGLVDRFNAAVKDTISFDFLRIRTWVSTNPEGAKEIVQDLFAMAEGEKKIDIAFHFHLLAAARSLDMHQTYLNLVKKIIGILYVESDLIYLLEDLMEYSRTHIRGDVAQKKILEIAKERQSKDPNALFIEHNRVLVQITDLINWLRRGYVSPF